MKQTKSVMRIVGLLVLYCSAAYSLAPTVPTWFGVDFCGSMQTTHLWKPSIFKKNRAWKLAYDQYDKFVINDLQVSEKTRIPKVVHHIWIGSKFPGKCVPLRQTWFDRNPEWTFIFWTNNPANHDQGDVVVYTFDQLAELLAMPNCPQRIVVNTNQLAFDNRKWFNKVKNYGQKSDILRYEILYRFGGLYVDTDFECLRSFDLLHHSFDFFAGTGFTGLFEVFNGLIAASPGHPILQGCVEGIPHMRGATILDQTGPRYLARWFAAKAEQDDLRNVAFPVTYLYSWPNIYRHQKARWQIERWFKPESYAVHHWHVSWSK